jgi:radical SAM protein with 4Fe4S-binding SPASM domain
VDELLSLSDRNKAGIILVYQLVPVGRGGEIKDAALGTERNRELSSFLLMKQRRVSSIIEPVACPQFWPDMLVKNGIKQGFPLKFASRLFYGCCAGRGFVYIKANGDVWPCPFLEISAGNILNQPFTEIWQKSDLFNSLRIREKTLKGKCGQCKYNRVCGGCRARAYIETGDHLGDDPACFIEK